MPGKDILKIEIVSGPLPGLPYAAGTVVGGGNGFGDGDMVLVETDCARGERVLRHCDECAGLGRLADANFAFALPPLAFALMAADLAGFEIGETAVVFGEGSPADIFCLTLKWCGALPCIRLGAPGNRIPGIESYPCDAVSLSNSIPVLKETFGKRPGLAVFDAGDDPDPLEFLFEHLPPWSRIVLAGNHRRGLNLDYYNDIHKKGVSLFFFRPGAGDALQLLRRNPRFLRKAERILALDARLHELRAAFPGLHA